MRDLNGKFIWRIKERTLNSPHYSKSFKSFDKLDDYSPFN